MFHSLVSVEPSSLCHPKRECLGGNKRTDCNRLFTVRPRKQGSSLRATTLEPCREFHGSFEGFKISKDVPTVCTVTTSNDMGMR